MVLAVLQFDLHVHDARSLKDKRRVVSSLKARLHREHLAAVAEVAHQDTLNLARMALVIIGSDARHLAQSLDRITARVREWAAPDAELGAARRLLVHPDQLEEPPEETDPSLPGDVTDDLLARGLEELRRADP
ncbi:MAG: DUF503 domain-containing protein [Phycisphaerales bacterium]